MLQHHIKLTLRGFRRFKTSFAINLIGLSSGLACALLIYLWVSDEYAMDNFHKDGDRLFQVLQNINIIDKVETIEMTPALLAETLNEELPILDKTVSVLPPGSYGSDGIVEYNGKKLKTLDQYASSEFFEVFSFPLVSGSPSQVLLAKESVVLSEAFAEKLFGKGINPIGESITWEKGGDPSTHIVTGIFEKLPNNTSRPFDVVFTMESFLDSHPHLRDWQNSDPSTFIVLSENASITGVQEQVNRIITAKWEGYRHSFLVQRYADRYLYGKYENGEAVPGRMQYVRLFSIVAGLVLLIACINFMNLSTARASRRLKEIGVKKSMGASRRSLAFQFYVETFVLTTISTIVAMAIVILLLPVFNEITGKSLELILTIELLQFLAGIIVITSILAGSYPAIYLSGFEAISILKGKLSSSIGDGWARKGLVMVQYGVSVILITSVLVVSSQIQFVLDKNLGFQKEQVIYFNADGRVGKNTSTFLSELQKIPGVVSTAEFGHDLLGGMGKTTGLYWEGKDPEARIRFGNLEVGPNLIETFGIEMAEGRTFDEKFGDEYSKIILNEQAIEVMGLEDPIGKTIGLWGQERQIIGVAKDFHFESLFEPIKPCFFQLGSDLGSIVVRIAPSNEFQTIERIEKLYDEFNPGLAFNFNFFDKEYENLYKSEQQVADLSTSFATIAIIVSCLGLFGLVAFTAEQKRKEIGIRKVLGASAKRIILLLSSDFMKLIMSAIIIALPIGYFIMKNWLDSFIYRIDLNFSFFVASGLMAILIAIMTMSIQTLKAANANPVDSLKDE